MALKLHEKKLPTLNCNSVCKGLPSRALSLPLHPLMEKAGLSEVALLKAIEDQLQSKFGSKGQRVVDDNMRVVRRGFDEVHEIKNKVLGAGSSEKANGEAIMPIPTMLKSLPQSESKLSDIHRFWEQTGNFYQRGMGNDNITDPFIGLSVMPRRLLSVQRYDGYPF
jgi:pyruvate-ferredoxin/flavodoxin oxidoreductase